MKIYYETEALERTIDTAPRITPSTKSVLKKIIRSAPVADAEPVAHGRWVPFHSQAAREYLVLFCLRNWICCTDEILTQLWGENGFGGN